MKRQVEWMNEAKGSLTGYDCPVCKNRGYIAVVRDGYLVSEACRCMTIRNSLRRLEKSGMKELLESKTLKNYQEIYPWQTEMKQRAERFIAHGASAGEWFAAIGSVGAGKTHICTAICGALIKAGMDVRYMLWLDTVTRLNIAIHSDPEEYQKTMDGLKTVRVLYIDDLFKVKDGAEISNAEIKRTFEIINFRCNNKKLITIISSQKTMGELLSLEEAAMSRVFERCKRNCMELYGDKNWRLA